MMSVFAGEITKQTRVAPAISMRSSRYSQTASGRPVWPSYRVPTGSSSLEKARGCMRVPRPAAGMTPQRRLMPPPQAAESVRDCDGRTYARPKHVHARRFQSATARPATEREHRPHHLLARQSEFLVPAQEKAVRAPAGDLAHKFRDKKDQQNIGGSGRPACEDQDRRYRRAAPRGELPARTEALLERVRPYNSKPDRTVPDRTVECSRPFVLARGVRA